MKHGKDVLKDKDVPDIQLSSSKMKLYYHIINHTELEIKFSLSIKINTFHNANSGKKLAIFATYDITIRPRKIKHDYNIC